MQTIIHPALTATSVERILGKGCEGVVYLTKDPLSGEKNVQKIFYEPIQGSPTRALRHYAANVSENSFGLPKIKLIECDDQVVGVQYAYTPLHNIHWRLFYSIDHLGQVLLGNFCRMQYYLMSNYGLVLTDPWLPNFMLAGDGLFHYIDFGYSIRQVTHPNIIDSGQIGYGFLLLLADIFHRDLKKHITPSAGYSYDCPCRYCSWEGFDEIAKQHSWVKEIIFEVRNQCASTFLDHEFYRCLAEKFPHRVKSAQWVIRFSNSIVSASDIKGSIKGK